MQRVGFIGLGLMGGPMAANVAKAGYPLTVYNRSPEKMAPLREAGAKVAASPREVAEHSDTIITMLADALAVQAVLEGDDGLLAGLRPGMVWIDMSTIAPDETHRFGERVASCGVSLLDAPVYGSTGPAKEGTLGIMVGGDPAVFEAQRAVLTTMGKSLFYLGESGSGTTVKLCVNLIVAAEMQSLAEAMTLAAKAGLDLRQVSEVITSSAVSSKLIEAKVKKIIERDFSPAFPLKHMQKDLGLMMNSATALSVPLFVTGVTHQLFSVAKANGHGDEDFSAIFALLASLAGMRS